MKRKNQVDLLDVVDVAVEVLELVGNLVCLVVEEACLVVVDLQEAKEQDRVRRQVGDVEVAVNVAVGVTVPLVEDVITGDKQDS